MNNNLDAIVIGSGVGGLSAALCLARAGKKVLIVEQHKIPGGWCQSFYLKGYRFSPGVHYLGGLDEGGSLYKLYRGLGVANHLEFYRMNPKAYEHAIVDGERFDFPNEINALKEKLTARFPKDKEGLDAYLSLVETIGNEIQIHADLYGIGEKIRNFSNIRHLIKYQNHSLKSVIDKYISDPVLKKVLNIQSGDHGMPPSKASFLVHCGVMFHYFKGGFYPKGGAAAIVKGMLREIRKYKGEIITGQKVEHILLEGKKKFKAVGVELENGEQIQAKRIISNADPEKTFLDMVGSKNISNKLLRRLNNTVYSCSSLILFLAVDMDVTKAGIDNGNFWISNGKDDDEDKNFNNLLQEDFNNNTGFPSLFVSCTTLKDPAHFDGKHHTLEVIAFTDYDRFKKFENNRNSPEYLQLKEKITDKFIISLEKIIPGISEKIVMKELATPLTNEFYINATHGNVYGTEKSAGQSGINSFKTKTEIQNLYLCGASTLSHGISGASYSGVESAANILNCSSRSLLQPDDNQKITIINDVQK